MVLLGVFGIVAACLRREWIPFGLCTCLLAYGVWQTVSPPTLTVTAGQVVIRHNGRSETFDLAKCSQFAVHRYRFGGRTVVFDCDDGRNGWFWRWVRRSNRKRSGASYQLIDNFGVPATELADLLNRSRSDTLDAVGVGRGE